MSKFEDNFDDKMIEKALKKAKMKSLIRNVMIVIVVLSLSGILNIYLSIRWSNASYEAKEEYYKFSISNAYISESSDEIKLLGGNGEHKISKVVGGMSVFMEDVISQFGIINPLNITRSSSGFTKTEDEDGFDIELWESGYKKMNFFHPSIKYKKYQNDLEKLDRIPDGKIIEMGISLDKSYNADELITIASDFKDVATKSIWINTYFEEDLKEYKEIVKDYDPSVSKIIEDSAMGIKYYNPQKGNLFTQIGMFNSAYNGWMRELEESKYNNELYKKLVNEGREVSSKNGILGFVVEGTKEELQTLLNKPYIKASSIGVVVDPLY